MWSRYIQNNNNVIYSPLDISVDLNKSLAEYIWDSIVKYGDNIAQINSDTGKKETYNELLDRIMNLAQALQNKGIKPKDVVAYCCVNNTDYIVVVLASLFIGAIFSGLDTISDTKEMAHCINIIDPKIIFCDENTEHLIEPGLNEAGITCDVIAFSKSSKFESMTSFIKKYKEERDFELYKNATLKDTCCILFTSGTSGAVKGALCSGYQMYYTAVSANRCAPNVKTIMIFTLTSWISNVSFTIYACLYGITKVIYKIFHKETFVKIINIYQVDTIMLTQIIMNVLMKHPECCQYDTSNVKYLLLLGSMFGKNTIDEINNMFPYASLNNCFGMTETGMLFISPSGKDNFDRNGRYTVGYPNPGYSYKIVDIATEECLGPNQQGELRVKFEGIMNGYIKNPEKTVEAFDEDGYFKTGDIAYYDNNYLFYIVNRLKEIFKYGGKHVSPTIIEDTLIQHSAVKDVAIVPIKDEKGEVPLACVALRHGVTATENDFVKYVQERLSDMYQLRGGVIFMESIPRNSRGKLKRHILKQQIIKEIQMQNEISSL